MSILKKTLVISALLISASMLSATTTADQNETILEGVKQLSEENMSSIKGEHIIVTVIYPSTGEKETYMIQTEAYRGRRLINGETGKVISEKIIYTGIQ